MGTSRGFLFGSFILSYALSLGAQTSDASDDAPETRPFDFIGNFPVAGEGTSRRLDTETFKKHYQDLNMQTYHYVYMRRAVDRALFKDQFEVQVLQHLGGSSVKMVIDENMGRPLGSADIRLMKTDNRHTYLEDKYGRRADRRSQFKNIFRAEAIEEIKSLARLAARYPEHLLGFHEDDFFARRKAPTMMDPAFFKRMCKEARAIHPSFKFGVTLYCRSEPATNPAGDAKAYTFLTPEQSARIDFSLPTRQIDPFLEYISDPEVSDCIDEIDLYNQGAAAEAGAMQPWTNKEFEDTQFCLQRLQEAHKPVRLGIYMSDYKTLSLEDRLQNIHLAFLTSAPGFTFFLTPVAPLSQDLEDGLKNARVYQELRGRIGYEEGPSRPPPRPAQP